jgi:Flp pilus assembly protein TadG
MPRSGLASAGPEWLPSIEETTAMHASRQRGAVILTAALFLLFLLGFMGIALDLGRLFVVKTELQTAMDSCALAAAQELDGQADALVRARNAGRAAGNLNRVGLQSATWSGQGQLVDTDITFRDAANVDTTSGTAARYARCAHTQPNMGMWLLPAMSAFSGTSAGGPAARSVGAHAIATRDNAQSTCPVPLALRPKAGGTAPDYGFAVGEWVTLLMAPGTAPNGMIGWANLDGSTNAAETERELLGHCGTRPGDRLGTPGVQASMADVWNYRFGIYRNSTNAAENHPDFTGYAYTALNWPTRFNAFNGDTPAGAPASAANYQTKRAAFASCADTGTRVRGANSCESITGLSLNSFQQLATPGPNAADGHARYGGSRRLVAVPVVDSSMRVVDFACMFLLQPLTLPMSNVQLEYRGNGSSPGSPCAPFGLAGGTTGPLVPVLVQ